LSPIAPRFVAGAVLSRLEIIAIDSEASVWRFMALLLNISPHDPSITLPERAGSYHVSTNVGPKPSDYRLELHQQFAEGVGLLQAMQKPVDRSLLGVSARRRVALIQSSTCSLRARQDSEIVSFCFSIVWCLSVLFQIYASTPDRGEEHISALSSR